MGKILGVENIAIGVELNKPDAIAALEARAQEYGVKIVGLKVQYPQGSEKQLIYAITGRCVPTGGLPMDAGCVVQNVATAAANLRCSCRRSSSDRACSNDNRGHSGESGQLPGADWYTGNQAGGVGFRGEIRAAQADTRRADDGFCAEELQCSGEQEHIRGSAAGRSGDNPV